MKVLALDLSTTSTGWALFEGKELAKYGIVEPEKPKGFTKLKYPKKQLVRIMSIATQVHEIVQKYNPDKIVIEEINRGINRIGQKSLDALHFFVLFYIEATQGLDNIKFIDSNGKKGWRTILKLSIKDKYKGKSVSERWKKVAEDFVNGRYKTNFSVWLRKEEADLCDAICLGHCYLWKFNE